MHTQLSPEILQQLETIVGTKYIFTDQETLNHYGHDETEDLVFPPNVVLKPANAQEISEILKIANQYKIPVTFD
jgi:glycolate oxidase